MSSRGGKRSDTKSAAAQLIAGMAGDLLEKAATDYVSRAASSAVPTEDPDDAKPLSRRRFVVTQCNSLIGALLVFMAALCFLMAKTELMSETILSLLNTTLNQFRKQNEYYDGGDECECQCPLDSSHVDDP